MRGIINIIIGIVFIVGSFTGTFARAGSRTPMVAVGSVLILLGIFRIIRR